MVRVATLNERRRVLVEGFRKLRPDLVAFQEAVVGGGYDQVTDILGPDYHVLPTRRSGRPEGAETSRTARASL
jgi:hypothetical protein